MIYVFIVAVSILVTLFASYVHHRFILGIDTIDVRHYIVPFGVGLLFGVLLSLLHHLYSSLKDKERLLQEMATTDPLTGLPNRRMLLDLLRIELERAKRKATPLSIAIIDVDDFKQINDTYGHLVGDEVLKEIAHTLKKNLRSTDIVGRFGGEEFIVIMPETDLNTAVKVMERLRRAIGEAYFEPVGSVSVSIGVSELSSGEDMDELIRRADENLYRAKREGKNRIVAG